MLFAPNYRNRDRQNYCPKPQCQKASKTDSQKKWLSKPENQDYFAGPDQVKRVQEWRRKNPGYWKRSIKAKPLQDSLITQPLDNNHDKFDFATHVLQDLLNSQASVIIGLISNFIGSALQDDIAQTLLRMQQSGQDILYQKPERKGDVYDHQNTHFKTQSTPNPQKLQLGRSPSG